MGLRLTAAIPLFASIISLALSIVILVAGSSTSTADDSIKSPLAKTKNIFTDLPLSRLGRVRDQKQINTSGIGTGIVQVKAADDSQTSGALGGLINSIPGLDSILDNLTNSVGDGLDDAQGQILGSLASGLGLQDYYALYTTKSCQGNFTSNATDADVDFSSCSSYSESGAGLINVTNSIPSSLVVGTAEVSVPLVESLKQILNEIANLATGSAVALMVFLIIATVAQGIVAVASLLGVLRSESRLITNVNLGFSTLAATALWLIAITMSLVIGIANSLIGGFGDGLSLHVQQGGAFLAILWVAAVLSAVASTYWLVVWFVEFRLSAFSRRRRNEAQVGGYRQMVGELRKDLKVDGHFDAHKTSVGQQERKEDDRS